VKALSRGIFLTIVILFLSTPHLVAQDESPMKSQVWAMGLFYWKINERWVFNEDISYQQLLSSPSYTRILTRSQINYQINGISSLHGGVVVSYTIDGANGDLFELSPWLGTKVRWPSFWRINFVHYVRFEERNRFEFGGEEGWSNVWRMRYRLSTDIPINHASITDNTIFGIAGYEYYTNESDGEETLWLPATHRFDVGIGYSPNYRTRFEIMTVFLDTHDSVTDEFDFTSAILFLRWRQNFNWR